MSHTDRHRPHWVQVADVWEKNKYRPEMWGMPNGYWGEWNLLHRTCGDKWCGGQLWSRAEVKADRHRAQRKARDAVKGGDWD
jgi:hypothetical protein